MSRTTWTCPHCGTPVSNGWPIGVPHCEAGKAAHARERKRQHAEALYAEVRMYWESLQVRHKEAQDRGVLHNDVNQCPCLIGKRWRNVRDLLASIDNEE